MTCPGRRERHGGLERGEELAHVSRPRPRLEGGRRLARQRRAPCESHLDEPREISWTLPERSQLELEPGQAEVQIDPERACLGHLLEGAVSRRQHAEVDAPDGGLTQPPDLAFLEDAQELALEGERQVADLVEERAFRRTTPRRDPGDPGRRP